MHERPPPIQLMVPFEAAARLGAFNLAAVELSVTASAISQQVRALEHYLDATLFTRHVRRIELTEMGEAYYQVAQQTLNVYTTNHSSFVHRFGTPALRISMISAIAYEWIIPKLSEFNQLHPNIDLRIEASETLVNFDREPIDAGIRVSELKDCPPTLESYSLAACSAAVVAKPELLESSPRSALEDLSQHTIIKINNSDMWPEVAKHFGLKKLDAKNDLIVDSYFTSMLAAEQGLGLAVGIFPLSDAWLNSGRLACATEKVPISAELNFAFPKNHIKRRQLMLFYEWLIHDIF